MNHTWQQPTKNPIAMQTNQGVTEHSLSLLNSVKSKLHNVAYVELMMPRGKDWAESQVRFIDSAGRFAHLDGFSWGYGGEGPHGLAKAFEMLGIPVFINQIAGWNYEHIILDCEIPAVHFIECHCLPLEKEFPCGEFGNPNQNTH
jgi:hypothetical protein